MNLVDKAFLLKKTSIFNSLDMDFLLAISDKAETVTFKPNTFIFSEGQQSFSLYIISEGLVRLSRSTASLEVNLKPYDSFGEEGLFSNKPRLYSAKAATAVKALVLSKGVFLCVIEECPSIAIYLLELYAKQVPLRLP